MNKFFKLAAAAVILGGVGFAAKTGWDKQREIDIASCETNTSTCPYKEVIIEKKTASSNEGPSKEDREAMRLFLIQQQLQQPQIPAFRN